ncbi:MAG: nuclease-related domain-containing protein [Salinisphaera sp.]|jgi:hypothetical protein|nr:nuclease-related domain-containing protein [Salinisphaera sp.]
MLEFIALFASLLVFAPQFLVALAVVAFEKRRRARVGARHPLTQGLLRPPGYSVKLRHEKIKEDVAFNLFVPSLIGLFGLTAAFVAPYLLGRPPDALLFWIFGFASIGSALWSAVKFVPMFYHAKALRLGWEGELATAEELNKLMRHGYDVFHDLPCDGFNIDHVIVGSSGVIAVETKTRTKQRRAPGAKNDWTATFDGKAVDFAGWRDTKSIEQARRQAHWLSQWLGKATGHSIPVTPAIALPGWNVDRKQRSDVRVFNPRQAVSMARGQKSSTLSDAQVKSVCYQLEQCCRQISADKVKAHLS